MQQTLLANHPTANVRVYVVWFSMLPQDSRSNWDGDLIPDERATHWSDSRRVVSRWIANHVQQVRGPVWDTYLLYGPDATWNEAPSPLLGSGRTVMDRRDQLAAQLLRFLTP